jgi:hypothetical protein
MDARLVNGIKFGNACAINLTNTGLRPLLVDFLSMQEPREN